MLCTLPAWGFYALAIDTPRFQYLMDIQELNFAGFQGSTAFFCIVATFAFPCGALNAIETFHQGVKSVANSDREAPLFSFTPALFGTVKFSQRLQLISLIAESLPQLLLNISYLIIVSNDPCTENDFEPAAVLACGVSGSSIVVTVVTMLLPGLTSIKHSRKHNGKSASLCTAAAAAAVYEEEVDARPKICVVGDPGVGKTCLLATYASGNFPDELDDLFDDARAPFAAQTQKRKIDGKECQVDLQEEIGQDDYRRYAPPMPLPHVVKHSTSTFVMPCTTM